MHYLLWRKGETILLTEKEVEILRSKLKSMIYRCNINSKNEKNKCYREKGITVCDEWINNPDKFIEFADSANFKEGLTIDRINSDKGYSPDNCRFIPMSEQPLNTDRNVFIDLDEEVIILSELARRCNVSPEAIRKRIKLGWYKVVDNPNKKVETLCLETN